MPGKLFAVRLPFHAQGPFRQSFPESRAWSGRDLGYPAVEGWVGPEGEPVDLIRRQFFLTKGEAVRAALGWYDPQIVDVVLS